MFLPQSERPYMVHKLFSDLLKSIFIIAILVNILRRKNPAC
jgi:hypothetical protein